MKRTAAIFGLTIASVLFVAAVFLFLAVKDADGQAKQDSPAPKIPAAVLPAPVAPKLTPESELVIVKLQLERAQLISAYKDWQAAASQNQAALQKAEADALKAAGADPEKFIIDSKDPRNPKIVAKPTAPSPPAPDPAKPKG